MKFIVSLSLALAFAFVAPLYVLAAHSVAAYTSNPAPEPAVPDDPPGQLTDGLWASAGALYDCPEAVGWFTGAPDSRYATIWFDLGQVQPLTDVTIGYWSATNLFISGPANITFAFSSLTTPNTIDPDNITDWSDNITDTTFAASDWTQTHFTHTTEILDGPDFRYARWVRARILIQNADYGARHLALDEVEFADPSVIKITQHPANAVRLLGETVTFSVTAVSSSNLYYQWYKQDTPLTDSTRITGANQPSLQITSLQTDDTSPYACTVTSDLDPIGVQSDPAFLSVLPPPLPYIFTPLDSSTVPDYPYGQLVDNLWAPPTADHTASQAVAWLLQTEAPTLTVWHNLGQVKDLSRLVIGYWCYTYQGLTRPYPLVVEFSSLPNPNVSDPDNTTDWSNPITDNSFEESYWSEAHLTHEIDLLGRSAQWVRLKLTPQNISYGPRSMAFDEIRVRSLDDDIRITTQPIDVTTHIGTTAAFTVAASGFQLQYLWMENDTPIPDANTPTLTLSNVTPEQSGNQYNCLIYNTFQQLPSDHATLTVTCYQNIPGDINHDCQVNLKDFIILSADWLDQSLPQ